MQADLGGVSVLKDANVDGCVRDSVYTMKRHDALPLPLVDKELATAVYDLRLHKYVHGVNIDWLKEHIMELYRLYKLGKFNIVLQK